MGKMPFSKRWHSKNYCGTAILLTASKLGIGSGDLPCVKVSGVPFLPESLAMMKNAVNTLEPVIRVKLDGVEAREPLKGRDCVRDQMAGTVLNVMMNIKRPEIDEMLQITQQKNRAG